MDRGACWATVHGVAKGRTRLSWLSTDTENKPVATNEGSGACGWGMGRPKPLSANSPETCKVRNAASGLWL